MVGLWLEETSETPSTLDPDVVPQPLEAPTLRGKSVKQR